MPSLTVGPLTNFSTLQFSTAVQGTFAQQLAQSIANTINVGANNGSLNQFVAPAGIHLAANGFAVAGEDARGFGGIATFRGTTSPQTLFVDGADQFIVVDSSVSPVSIQGGAAGGSLISGAGTGLTYTNITPSGTGTDQIVALGGNNLIQTSFAGGGRYLILTGDGNDTVNVLTGSATVNAGVGNNQINVGLANGSSVSTGDTIQSEGFDLITGAGYGTNGGTDTVAIGSGQTTINSGGTSFLVNYGVAGTPDANGLLVSLGSGVDTINGVSGDGSITVNGINTTTRTSGAVTITGGDLANGDVITLAGSSAATISARAGNNAITAGSGNDTLIAGTGADTLTAGTGASQLLQSGTGAGTTFVFNFGQSGAGSDTITGFKASDQLVLNGNPNPAVLGTGTATAGGAQYQLGDGTTLTIIGTQPAGGFRNT